MRTTLGIFALSLGLMATFFGNNLSAAEPIKVMLLDGQNNHKWEQTSPVLLDILAKAERFEVDRVTSPPKNADMSEFKPDFASYDVIVSNYNGDEWSDETKLAFEDYVAGGGGFVSFHAANNAFPNWPAYNEMIGIGGWGGRNEESGPYAYWKEGKLTKDKTAGRGGSHGSRVPFLIEHRQPTHPIVKGLPEEWMHNADELYSRLRGPAKRMRILATAYSDPDNKGTGQHEPMLMVLRFGKGRVFHTTLGHDTEALRSAGFQATFVRGVEWAATGKVTLTEVPEDFPGTEEPSLRPLPEPATSSQ
ncbi:Trehalose utilization [Planctomycetales bacterium 10988]|nr:Trehalose utilization [Planctomycetales bacterium 10988]